MMKVKLTTTHKHLVRMLSHQLKFGDSVLRYEATAPGFLSEELDKIKATFYVTSIRKFGELFDYTR